MEYKNTDYKLVTTGNARVGYCSKCGGNGWYDTEKISDTLHQLGAFMKNIHFGNGDITTLILIKEDAINKLELHNHYLNKLSKNGIPKNNIAILPLLYNCNTFCRFYCYIFSFQKNFVLG